MSIFNSESENDRFERHMRPIRAIERKQKIAIDSRSIEKGFTTAKKNVKSKKI